MGSRAAKGAEALNGVAGLQYDRQSFAIAADGFSRAAFPRHLRQNNIFRRLRLAMDDGVTAFVEAFKELRGGVRAHAAINTGAVHEIPTWHVLRRFE
jgi:hypothetical protein